MGMDFHFEELLTELGMRSHSRIDKKQYIVDLLAIEGQIPDLLAKHGLMPGIFTYELFRTLDTPEFFAGTGIIHPEHQHPIFVARKLDNYIPGIEEAYNTVAFIDDGKGYLALAYDVNNSTIVSDIPTRFEHAHFEEMLQHYTPSSPGCRAIVKDLQQVSTVLDLVYQC